LSFKTADAKPSDMVTTPSPQPNCAEQWCTLLTAVLWDSNRHTIETKQKAL
jgi:hypothetical protein